MNTTPTDMHLRILRNIAAGGIGNEGLVHDTRAMRPIFECILNRWINRKGELTATGWEIAIGAFSAHQSGFRFSGIAAAPKPPNEG